MGWLQNWVTSGGLVDTVIVITLFEITGLLVFYQQTKRGLKPRDFLLNALSGLCLMVALRDALTSGPWYVIAVWLTLAGVAHTADVALRLHQRRG